MPKFKTCDGCGNEFPVSMLRYHKSPDGIWRYLCKMDRDTAKADEATAKAGPD